jgi:hypothetical protein
MQKVQKDLDAVRLERTTLTVPGRWELHRVGSGCECFTIRLRALVI